MHKSKDFGIKYINEPPFFEKQTWIEWFSEAEVRDAVFENYNGTARIVRVNR